MVHYSLVYYKMKMIWRNQSNSSTYDWFMAKNHTFRAFWAYIEPKWANSGKTRFFGGNWTRSLLTPYSALTSCKKSEKSLEPFSSNMGITLLLGPFWAIRPLKYHISAHFGKTGFFPEKRPCTFLALIVVNLIPEYEENPWSGFWEISVTNYQPTTGVILWDLAQVQNRAWYMVRPPSRYFWVLNPNMTLFFDNSQNFSQNQPF